MCSSVDVSLVLGETVLRELSSSSTMIRSRVTLASTLAAAMHAATWSPFQHRQAGHAEAVDRGNRR